MRRATSRPRSVLLLLCLVALAALLTIFGAGLGTSLFQTGGAAPKQSHTSPITGTLLVRTFLGGNGTDETPLSNVNVSVTDVDHPLLFNPVLHTNATGEVEVDLAPAEYAISVFNVQFRTSTQAEVYANKTTELDAAVNIKPYPAIFTEITDPESSGYQGPWTPVTIALSSPSTTFQPNEQVFIDANYSSDHVALYHDRVFVIFVAGQTQAETQATVISFDLRTSALGSVLWLTLRPANFMPVSGLLSVRLATYVANLRVTIYGP